MFNVKNRSNYLLTQQTTNNKPKITKTTMKELNSIFAMCKTNVEVACMILTLCIGYLAWVGVFWTIHPLCGVMSIAYYPMCLIGAARIVRITEHEED